MLSVRNRIFACVSALVLAALAHPGRAQSAPATGAADPTSLTEVIVTAQKRRENIQDVGMSIQAATGEKMAQLGVTDPSQLIKIVPGFNYTPSPFSTPVYTIRGIGFQDTSISGSPTVSVYLDEAPLPFSTLTQGASLDVQRVEVLKGPQGTLFGENATGGAVNYVANKPTDHFEAGADVSYGRFSTADLAGYVGGPVTSTLDFRVALRLLQSDDWQKSYTHNATNGAQDFLNGRAALLWRPDADLKVMLTVSGWRDRSDTQMGQLYGVSPNNARNGADPRVLNYPRAPHDAQAADWGACVNTSPLDPPFDTAPGVPTGGALPTSATSCTDFKKSNVFYSGTLRIDYDLGHDMTLTSMTARERYTQKVPVDDSGEIYQDFQSLHTGHIDTTYQELRLTGKFAGRGDWIVGGNYEYDSTLDTFLQSYGDGSITPIFGLRFGPTRPTNQQHTSTYAVYGNAEYPIIEAVTLQAGVRFTQTDKTFQGCGADGGDGTWATISQQIQDVLEAVYNPADGVQGQGVNVGPGGCATTGPGPTFNPQSFRSKLNESNVSWRVGVNWRWARNELLYFNVSQGYKAGGFPTAPASSYVQLRPVVQEGLLAYEGGFKSTLLDGTLQLNGAGFYYRYHNKQILGALNDPFFGPLSALVNVPRSHVVGFELSGIWQPVPGLTITPSQLFEEPGRRHIQ